MPGQYKQGLDFWPRSVLLARDPKLRTPKMRYGYLAVIVYELLLDLLFSDKGYFIDFSRREDVIWTVLEGLLGKHQPTYETIAGCIEALAACELFCGDRFKRHIITSRRAQETFYRATAERKMANIDWDIWMLSEAAMRQISTKSVILKQFLGRQANDGINRPDDPVNRPDVAQSKVKKISSYYEEHTAGTLSPTALAEITDFLAGGLHPDLVCRAIDISIDAGVRNWPYAKSILTSCLAKSIMTTDTFDKHETNRTKSKQGQSPKAAKIRFQNYPSRNWDYDKLAQAERAHLEKYIAEE